MKQVKIISGLYGYKPIGSKFVTPIHAGEVVEVSDEEAERLVAIGIGLCIGVASPETGIKPVATPIDGRNDAEGDNLEGEENAYFDVKQLKTMTNANLNELAMDMGIDTSKIKTKAEFINAITSTEVIPNSSEGDNSDDGEEPPSLCAEDPVT